MSDNELIFVYNANSGIFNEAKDFFHKSVSPKTYGCNLCGLTYGISMKKDWKYFIDNLGTKAVFLHKDEFKKQFPQFSLVTYPVVFSKNRDELKEFISTNELNEQENLEELKKLVQDKMKQKIYKEN